MRLITLVPCVAVIVPPPQEPVRPLGVEITRPAGSVSLKPRRSARSSCCCSGIVKLRLVEPFSGMLAAPNALIITGGTRYRNGSVGRVARAASVEVTWTLLFFTPAVVPCTFTETVQLALAAKVPAERLMLPEPATAVAVPPQVLFKALGVATTRSCRQIVSKGNSGQRQIGVRVLDGERQRVVPFSGMLAAPKAFVIVGGVATVRLAEAVLPVPPLVEVTFPVVLVYCPRLRRSP